MIEQVMKAGTCLSPEMNGAPGGASHSGAMNICFLNMQIEYYSPVSGGAIATIIMEYARNLTSRGHRATVVTIANEDATYDVGNVVPLRPAMRENLGFVQRRLSGLLQRIHQWDYPHYLYYMKSFTRALRRLSPAPDAVMVFNDFVSARYVKKVLPGTKVLLGLQNEQRTNLRDKEAAFSYIDLFLPCSGYISDWTSRTYGIPQEKLSCVSGGVDLAAFKPRVNYLADSKPLRVLFIGRIDPNKGPDIVADAVAKLRSEGVPVLLTVAGGLWFYGHGGEMTNPYFRSLKAKMDAASANYTGHVVRSKVPELVRNHDVVCVLSRSQEPFGLVVLEAMASGCAVIASDRGGLPEACGGAAMLVNPDNFEAIVGWLRKLATDREALRAAKLKAIERASSESWSAKTDLLETALRRVTGIQ